LRAVPEARRARIRGDVRAAAGGLTLLQVEHRTRQAFRSAETARNRDAAARFEEWCRIGYTMRLHGDPWRDGAAFDPEKHPDPEGPEHGPLLAAAVMGRLRAGISRTPGQPWRGARPGPEMEP
jgi:hypothetical protein